MQERERAKNDECAKLFEQLRISKLFEVFPFKPFAQKYAEHADAAPHGRRHRYRCHIRLRACRCARRTCRHARRRARRRARSLLGGGSRGRE